MRDALSSTDLYMVARLFDNRWHGKQVGSSSFQSLEYVVMLDKASIMIMPITHEEPRCRMLMLVVYHLWGYVDQNQAAFSQGSYYCFSGRQTGASLSRKSEQRALITFKPYGQQ